MYYRSERRESHSVESCVLSSDNVFISAVLLIHFFCYIDCFCENCAVTITHTKNYHFMLNCMRISPKNWKCWTWNDDAGSIWTRTMIFILTITIIIITSVSSKKLAIMGRNFVYSTIIVTAQRQRFVFHSQCLVENFV